MLALFATFFLVISSPMSAICPIDDVEDPGDECALFRRNPNDSTSINDIILFLKLREENSDSMTVR